MVLTVGAMIIWWGKGMLIWGRGWGYSNRYAFGACVIRRKEEGARRGRAADKKTGRGKKVRQR